ncbi:hypothetical protein GCM10007978_05290 [Shewanella hanedai]|uniref:Uncharacterized protein n=1 Tax=Shewanella hanedai TaxID=25 RepID=A0A553JTQ7_SHEHA|nr:hypothetical protein [Shewanella hanedai]TRY15820.1 hypothetical protein FN961_02220 [Shewanella hanedai]GGI70263.1 hypothetical protein GCM10007978_05290 [Shewanella hanedai]
MSALNQTSVLDSGFVGREYFLRLLKMHFDSFNCAIDEGQHSIAERHMDAISAMHNLSGVILPDDFVCKSLQALNWLMLAAMGKAIKEGKFARAAA